MSSVSAAYCAGPIRNGEIVLVVPSVFTIVCTKPGAKLPGCTTVSAGESAKIRIERTVFLIDHKYVFDVLIESESRGLSADHRFWPERIAAQGSSAACRCASRKWPGLRPSGNSNFLLSQSELNGCRINSMEIPIGNTCSL